jgi:GDPmannose 4,6-dehydratase
MDGEALTHFLLNKDYTVIGTYRKNSQLNLETISGLFNNHSNLNLSYCDIVDSSSVTNLFKETLEKQGKIDEVYLLAAQSHVGKSFYSPESTVLTNGMPAYYFLENIRLLSPKTRLYFAATSELLGGDPSRCPFDESSEYECRSPYSVGKELGTRWIKYYNQTYGTFASYGLLFNHSNTSRGRDFFIRKVTSSAARIALGKEKELSLGNLEFYRDEHWSDFGVEMMHKMLQLDRPDVFIVCKGECYHGEQFLSEAFGYFNLDWKKYVKLDKSLLRANEVVKLVGNPEKAIQKLGWNPKRMPFKDHIKLMAAYDYELELGNKPNRPDVFALFPN